MGLISSYSDDAATTDNDRFITYAADGTTKNTPASNINKYMGDGWILSGDSWSFSSYNSSTGIGVINANSGANTKYSAGNWIRFVQPTLGTKYAVITSTATTSITAKFKNGTVLSNEAITSPVYSTAATPNGAGLVSPEARAGGFVTGIISSSVFSSTGVKGITGIGFTPKMVKFIIQPTPSTSSSAYGTGVMTADGTQYFEYTSSQGGTYARDNGFTAAIVARAGGSNGVFVAASFSSMDPDGFSINVTTANAAAFPVRYEACA